MKVLHVAKIVGIAGAESYLLRILPAMKNAGLDVEFLGLTPTSQKGDEVIFNQKLEASGIKVHQIYYKRISRSTRKAIREVIVNGNYDLVNTHMIHADLFVAMTRKFGKEKFNIVSTKHGHDETYMHQSGFDPNGKKVQKFHRAAKFSEKQMLRSFAISKGLRDLFVAHGICDKDKIDIIYHGLDVDNSHLIDDPNIRRSKKQLIMVARFTDLKGHDEALEALDIVRKNIPEVHLTMVGDGKNHDRITAKAASLQLHNNIEFVGYQPNGTAYMASGDVVLIPSSAEGFGLVCLEAYSVKKPVVIFDVPALNELVEDGKTGLIAEPGNVNDLADKIEKLLNNDELRTQLGEQGLAHMKSHFNEKLMLDQTIQFYEKCLG